MGLNGHSAAKLVKNTRQAFLLSKQIKQAQILSVLNLSMIGQFTLCFKTLEIAF